MFSGVLDFWFKELGPDKWFESSDSTDNLIKSRFQTIHSMATKGELFQWRQSPEGRLAEIIVLDQFSRNIYRGTPGAFANDEVALALAQEMVARELDLKLSVEQRAFVYMPYMHSESKIIHDEAVKLFSIPGLENNYKFEILHKEIIDRFGRYPHRNKILNRTSTAEEKEFLLTHKGF